MRIRKISVICLSTLLVISVGCSTPSGEKTKVSSSGSVATSSSSSASQIDSISSVPEAVSAQNLSSQPASSEQNSSKRESSKVESKKSQNDNEWVAYNTNKDNYKLHIKRKDGTEDKVIVNDIVLAPCVAGEWVYFFSDLSTIEKVRLDGSQRTKVCGTDGVQVYDTDINAYHGLSGSTDFTGEYKDGYILYKFIQLKQAGDENKKSNPPSYYKLDLKQNKLIPVKN